ncbi:MAG TPA: hypothetical protein PKA58_26845, partial [Polyangium sp.]|nr:hypothetical protein [Polyangium sp.]
MRIFVCTFVAGFMSVGCANSSDATNKQLAAIQLELGKLRAENAMLSARLETLEMSRSRPTNTAGAVKSTPTKDDDRPQLDVLRLAPTADQPSTPDKPNAERADATRSPELEQDEPRPVLRSNGRGEVVAESPRPSKSPVPPRPAT